MNCNDVAAILNEHRKLKLTAAERSTVDEHLCACDDCAAAWHAESELLGLDVPAAPASLRAGVLASLSQVAAQPRRSRAPLIVGSFLIAGAAFAGIAVVSLTAPPSADTVATPTSATSVLATEAAEAPITNTAAATGAAEPTDGTTAVEWVTTSLQLVPFVRVNPNYPPDALAEKLEGNVIMEFTVTATGEVEDARVVESTDARFDASALAAVVQWKYLPRIVAGTRAATENVRTRLTFQLATPPQTPAQAAIQRASQPAGPGLLLDSAAFETTMLTAWQRVIADDLRSAELGLDEFRATYALPPFTQGEVWNAYAYVYTLQGNYDRAIEAYESAISVFARSGLPTQGRWVELANLYFARNQYDLALNTLLRPQRASGIRRATPEAQALLDKLRALGITEETVPAR